jgi:hypothetical protein
MSPEGLWLDGSRGDLSVLSKAPWKAVARPAIPDVA